MGSFGFMRGRRNRVEAAARWALRQREGGAVEGPWLGDPAREALYQDVAATLEDSALDEALSACVAPVRSAAPRRALRRPGVAWGPALAMAACAAAAIVAGPPLWRMYGPDNPPPLHFETARGQMLPVRLADGSQLELNGATSLDVQIGRRSRRVFLRRGQAFFDVAHQPQRPFEVRTTVSRAVVLGTAFDLDLTRGGVALAVYRGRVRFGALAQPRAAVDVDAGRRTVLRDATPAPLGRFDASQEDWRQGWLDTDGIALGQLVEELNRRGGPYIVSETTRIAGIRITGRFKLSDPDQLLDALGQSYDFRVVRRGGRLLLAPNG